MSDDSSNDSGSTDLKQTIDCVNQITREFESLTAQLRRDRAMIETLSMQFQRSSGRAPANRQTTALPALLEGVAQSLARQKALGKQLINDVAVFAAALNRWAADIEKRRSQQGAQDGGKEIPRYSAAERAAEAVRLEQLAESLLEKAQDEKEEANLAVWEFGMGDEYQRHSSAAKALMEAAQEMRRRAYILKHGEEGNYRQLMLEQYGINNPDLDAIAAYFAERFNDQETLDWLHRQHPATRPRFDLNSVAMMLIPEAELFDGSTGAATKIDDTALPPNYKAVEYVREPSTIMEDAPSVYQDGAPASRFGMAPRLSAVDLRGKTTAKFDGVDVSTGEMVDRKLNVADRRKFINEALRQSATAEQNGFTVRWEVPTEAIQAKARRILSTYGIKNINVVVVNP